jgi:hypothetical protein
MRVQVEVLVEREKSDARSQKSEVSEADGRTADYADDADGAARRADGNQEDVRCEM